jgi:hypothetical protein
MSSRKNTWRGKGGGGGRGVRKPKSHRSGGAPELTLDQRIHRHLQGVPAQRLEGRGSSCSLQAALVTKGAHVVKVRQRRAGRLRLRKGHAVRGEHKANEPTHDVWDAVAVLVARAEVVPAVAVARHHLAQLVRRGAARAATHHGTVGSRGRGLNPEEDHEQPGVDVAEVGQHTQSEQAQHVVGYTASISPCVALQKGHRVRILFECGTRCCAGAPHGGLLASSERGRRVA